jgi:enamine deaminase RidA (YjgF/YER057c/UK114 family)
MTRHVANPDWSRFKRATYSAAARVGDTWILSGIGSTDPDGELLHAGNLVEQTRQIYVNASEILRVAGASMDAVVKTVDYIVPAAMDDYQLTRLVRLEFFSPPYPAATGVVVHSLLRKGMLIEIEFWAAAEAAKRKGSRRNTAS